MAVRDAVNKVIEVERTAGKVRGSLDTAVALYCADELRDCLQALGSELRFVLITSGVTVAPLSEAPAHAMATDVDGLCVDVVVCDYEKCERCWHRQPEVGSLEVHPTLCGRCVENIDGAGEVRQFA